MIHLFNFNFQFYLHIDIRWNLHLPIRQKTTKTALFYPIFQRALLLGVAEEEEGGREEGEGLGEEGEEEGVV